MTSFHRCWVLPRLPSKTSRISMINAPTLANIQLCCDVNLEKSPFNPSWIFYFTRKTNKTFQDIYCVFNTLRKYPNYFHASSVFAWKVQKQDLKPDVCFVDATDWWFDSRSGPGLPSLWDASVFFGEAGGPVFPSFHSEEPLPWTDPTGLRPLWGWEGVLGRIPEALLSHNFHHSVTAGGPGCQPLCWKWVFSPENTEQYAEFILLYVPSHVFLRWHNIYIV